MILLKLITTVACGALFYWGGYDFNIARRYIMPIILAAVCAFIVHTLWIYFAMMPMIAALCLGYGENSPLERIFGMKWCRGVWGLIVALAASLGLVLGGFMHIYWFILYLFLGFALEDSLQDLPQYIGDPIIGCVFGALVFLI